MEKIYLIFINKNIIPYITLKCFKEKYFTLFFTKKINYYIKKVFHFYNIIKYSKKNIIQLNYLLLEQGKFY